MNTTQTTNEIQLTQFTHKKQQPGDEERARLRFRLYQFSNINRLAKVFKRTPQQIQQAFQGKQPTLMNKISFYIEKREKQISLRTPVRKMVKA